MLQRRSISRAPVSFLPLHARSLAAKAARDDSGVWRIGRRLPLPRRLLCEYPPSTGGREGRSAGFL